jgi:zinc transport system substrate-binding protein
VAHFAEQVGKDHVSVTNITPAGAEPHDYEPTPGDLTTLNQAKLVILSGSGVDTWGDKLQPDLEKKGVKVVKMSDHITLLPTSDPAEAATMPNDPHFWLDPNLAQAEVAQIRDALVSIDPGHKDDYTKNAADYIAQLAILGHDFQGGLKTCALREGVTSHAAFGYLAKRYNMTIYPISGLSPDQEPSAKQLADLTNLIKQKHISYIFYETLVSPKLSETLATTTGAKTLVFNPLEGLKDDEIKAGKTYLSVMRENLQNLRTALQCQ